MAKRYRYLVALLSLVLLGGCADSPPPTAETSPAPSAGQIPPNGAPAATPGAPPAATAPAAPQAVAALPVAAAPPPPDPSFTPLPSPDQVKRAQPIGQLDPFRPLTEEIRDLVPKPKASPSRAAAWQSRAAKPLPLEPPQGLQITGLIGGAGRPEAVISYQGANGTVRVGDVGASSGAGGPNATNLLPEGWRVASIDLNRGAIVLEFKGQTTKKQI